MYNISYFYVLLNVYISPECKTLVILYVFLIMLWLCLLQFVLKLNAEWKLNDEDVRRACVCSSSPLKTKFVHSLLTVSGTRLIVCYYGYNWEVTITCGSVTVTQAVTNRCIIQLEYWCFKTLRVILSQVAQSCELYNHIISFLFCAVWSTHSHIFWTHLSSLSPEFSTDYQVLWLLAVTWHSKRIYLSFPFGLN